MLKGFRDFILRGNVIDLAVAVLIGAAFGAIITSFTEDLLTPLIGAFGGVPDFAGLSFTINNSEFRYGAFINAVISFLITAAVIYFLVVLPTNRIMERMRRASPADVPPAPSREEVLLAEIRDAIRQQRG